MRFGGTLIGSLGPRLIHIKNGDHATLKAL